MKRTKSDDDDKPCVSLDSDAEKSGDWTDYVLPVVNIF